MKINTEMQLIIVEKRHCNYALPIKQIARNKNNIIYHLQIVMTQITRISQSEFQYFYSMYCDVDV